MKNVVLGGVVGFALGAGALWALTSLITDRGQINEAAEAKPLYWVAPMDPNYRRDKPGKSPMGMD